jgi:glycosyltransferase involved in cell wall biosynthesis
MGLFLYSPSLKQWLNENIQYYNIVHMHNFRSYQNNIVKYYAQKYSIPYILQAHGSVQPFFEKQNLKKIYDFFYGNQILKFAVKCIAVSKIEKKQYLKMGIDENKIEIIPNGLDLMEYNKIPEYGKFRERLGIPLDKKIILFLGRIHKSKGIDWLIEAYSKCLVYIKNSYLIIIGPNDGYLERLKEQVNHFQIRNNVYFVEPLYGDDKKEALLDSDVFVYPSPIEIFGLVPLEAIMCGTPVIVCEETGCAEIISDGQFGYIFNTEDIVDLSNKIIDVIDNSNINLEKVQRGQEYIKNHLGLTVVISFYEKLYRNIINEYLKKFGDVSIE